MAKQTKMGLVAKLGTKGRKAHEAHKADETKFDTGGDLPAGIDGGVAQLVECKFDTYKEGENKGEYFFYAAGIVVEPKIHEGVKVQGRRTQIMEPLCDTPNRSRKTVEEHLAWIYNELRKLGVDTEELEFDDLESTVTALKEEAPYFTFRTWKGEPSKEFPNPRVNHVWQGINEDFTPEDDDDEVEDNTADDDAGEEEEEEAPAKKPGTKKPGTKKKPKPEPEEDEEEADEEQADDEEEEEDEEESSDDLLKRLGKEADGDDEDAQEKLTELAEASGLDPEDYKTWSKVAAAIIEAQASSDDEEEEADEEEEEDEDEAAWEPAKEEVYKYKPPKAKKAVECEVMAVFAKNQTVNLKNLDDGKTVYKSVAWDKLESA